MNWRQWLGLTRRPQADLAHSLLAVAQSAGDVTWRYEPTGSSLRSGERVINRANLYPEYSRAPRSARAGLLSKYGAMIVPKAAQVAALWSVAQTHLYPLLRSRFERMTIEIQRRGKDPIRPRAAQPFLAELELVLGYDQGPTVSQVQQSAVVDWGVTVEAALERADMNLRALPPPQWQPIKDSLWALQLLRGNADAVAAIPIVMLLGHM